MVKKVSNISLAIKMLKKLNLYEYFFQNWMPIEETLMKLNICLIFIKNDELLRKYSGIWGKVKNTIKKEFDSESVYNEKHLKAKIEYYNGKTNTDFQNNENPKEGFQ